MRRAVLAALLAAAAFANVPAAQAAEQCVSHSLPTEPHKVCVFCDRVVCIYDLP